MQQSKWRTLCPNKFIRKSMFSVGQFSYIFLKVEAAFPPIPNCPTCIATEGLDEPKMPTRVWEWIIILGVFIAGA